MRSETLFFRLATAAAIGPMLLAPLGAAAQAPAAPGPSQPFAAQPAAAVIDPPALVGRLARMQGTVSFHAADQLQWQAAALNYPVSAGNAFWTQPGAEAEIEIGPVHVAMAASTEFDIDTLDDRSMVATLAQGEIYLRIPGLAQGGSVQVRTPRGLIGITVPGRYGIVAGDTGHPTMVTVFEGAATVTGSNVQVAAAPQQCVQITGSDPFQAVTVAATTDAFIAARLAEERPPVPRGAAPPVYVAQMTGGDALAETGEWQPNPEYGQVWYPPVAADWVPYREGHWAYVQPWGWTWVDNASWGFAPFHYGRWSRFGDRWGWVPGERDASYGPSYRPVYSPALVSFVGIGAAAVAGLAVGAAVGWIPLGPREPYYPPYRTSPGYVRQINTTYVNDPQRLGAQAPAGQNFMNRGLGATVVPAEAMAGSRPVAAQAQRLTPQLLATARPVGAPPVQPTAATAGVTPNVARQFGLTPATAPAAPGPAFGQRAAARTPGGVVGTNAAPRAGTEPGAAIAPGPAIAPGAMRPGGVGGEGVARAPGAPGPAIPGAGVPGAGIPGAGLPGAVIPGAARPGGAVAGAGAPGPAIVPRGPLATVPRAGEPGGGAGAGGRARVGRALGGAVRESRAPCRRFAR